MEITVKDWRDMAQTRQLLLKTAWCLPKVIQYPEVKTGDQAISGCSLFSRKRSSIDNPKYKRGGGGHPLFYVRK